MNEQEWAQLEQALGRPPEEAVQACRRRVMHWFAQTAPLIRWDVIPSPLGALYIAASERGLLDVSFGVSQNDFLTHLDPLARTEQNSDALAFITRQLQSYFNDPRFRFDVPLDLDRLSHFQRSVLQIARRIPPGNMWTYGQVARAIGKPQASRAVGQALGHNPVPIIIPCHRVIASDGRLGGYSGGSGVESKKLLLRLEGAIQ